MEPTTQNGQNEIQKTIWITIISIIVIALLIWGGIYMYKHRLDSGNQTGNSATSTATSTPINLGEDNRVVTNDEKAAVGAYLSSHINELSPKKAAAGRSFKVTNVTIEAAGRAIVEYTDGRTDYAAAIKYSLDSSGTIVVNNFDILEK